MVVRESSETAFGTPVKGVEIRLTLDEARAVKIMLGQGIAHPPMKGMNTDYESKSIGATLAHEINSIVSRS